VLDQKMVLLGGLLPASVCLLILIAGWRPWRVVPPSRPEWSGALALGGAFVLGAGLLLGWPRFPPAEPAQWLVYLPLLAILASNSTDRSMAQEGVVTTLLAMLCAGLVVPSQNLPDYLVLRAGLAAIILCLLLALEPLARMRQGPAGPMVLLLWCGAAAGLLILAGIAKFAMLAAIMAACCAGGVIAGLARADFTFAGGALVVVTLLIPGLLFSAWIATYSPVPGACFILVAAAPLAWWVGQIRPLKRRRWAGLVAGVFGVMVPIAVALVLAYRAQPFSAE
jgi:hypothetical protein